MKLTKSPGSKTETYNNYKNKSGTTTQGEILNNSRQLTSLKSGSPTNASIQLTKLTTTNITPAAKSPKNYNEPNTTKSANTTNPDTINQGIHTMQKELTNSN